MASSTPASAAASAGAGTDSACREMDKIWVMGHLKQKKARRMAGGQSMIVGF
jgi:hypothetical protein